MLEDYTTSSCPFRSVYIRRPMAGIVNWVSERLHEILGLSDRQVAEYMVELATKSKSSKDLTKRLQKSGTIEVNSDVKHFAAELWSRCVGGTSEKQPAEPGAKRQRVGVDEKPRLTKASRNIRSQRAAEESESDEEEIRPPSGADDSDSDEWERFVILV